MTQMAESKLWEKILILSLIAQYDLHTIKVAHNKRVNNNMKKINYN